MVMEALRRWFLTAVAASMMLTVGGMAAEDAARPPEGKGTVISTPGGGKLLINAKSVLYDFARRSATFEEQVSVTDSQVMLTARRMEVFLTPENRVERVEALGEVVIRELGTAKKATAGKAIYDTVADTVVLTEQPYLEELDQGFFTKGADRITYFRAKQQFKAEGDQLQIEFGIPEDRAKGAGSLFRLGAEDKPSPPAATPKETVAP